MLKIEPTDYPSAIIDSLNKLSKYIDITRAADKGNNGFLFFGKNHILNKEVAIKYYCYNGDKDFHAEPQFLASFESKNILKIHHAETISNEYALFITDFCKNGDLDDYMQSNNLSVKDALTFTHELLKGVCDLHSKKLVHRDLKPQNILIDDNKNIVIGDFGSVKKIPDELDSIPGSRHTILYRPPEAFDTNHYYFNSDIYQVGIILYQLLGGFLSYREIDYLNDAQKEKYNSLTDPWEQQGLVNESLKNKILKGKLLNYSSLPVWIDKSIIRIIQKATNINYSKRYSSCSEMMLDITKIRKTIFNWVKVNSDYILLGDPSYRVVLEKNLYHVERMKHSNWRKDNSFSESTSASELINSIIKSLRKR